MLTLMAMLAAVAQIAPGAAAEPGPTSLHLICRGGEDRAGGEGGLGALLGGRRTEAARFSSRGRPVQQLDVDIEDDAARARPPRQFVPALHGGDSGWFDVKDLAIDDEIITGTILLNYETHPKLRIDRRTGAVELRGKTGVYVGQCERYDPAKRLF